MVWKAFLSEVTRQGRQQGPKPDQLTTAAVEMALPVVWDSMQRSATHCVHKTDLNL